MKAPAKFLAFQRVKFRNKSWEPSLDMLLGAMKQDDPYMKSLELAYMHILKAEKYSSNKNPLAAFFEARNALRTVPQDVAVQNEFGHYRKTLRDHFIDLAWANPENPELGFLHEIFEDMGYHTLESQCLSALHFYMTGQLEKCRYLVERISRLFPNAFFLSDLKMILDNKFESSTPLLSPTTKATLDMTEVKRQKNLLSEIYGQINNNDFNGAIAKAERLIGCQSITEQSREFFYVKAICLDMTTRHLDALDILLNLTHQFPYNVNYNKSQDIVINNLQSNAHVMALEDPNNEILLSYFEVLSEYHYSPMNVTAAAAGIYLKKGELDKAKYIIDSLVKMSPNDPEYIRHGIDFYKSCPNVDEASVLEKKLLELQKTFFYDVHFF